MPLSLFPSHQIRVDEKTTRLFSISGSIETNLPALWLRERSQHKSQLDKVTRQRLFNPHELPADITYIQVRDEGAYVFVAFSDGHEEHYSRADLLSAIHDQYQLPSAEPWESSTQKDAIDYSELSNDQGMLEALSKFIESGYLLIKHTPTASGSIFKLAELFGYVRTTNFGRLFEVYSRPDSSDLAYRHNALSPHTDNPYRDPVPGIQLLHCLINDPIGGDSTLVDSLAVCERLEKEHPDSLDLLKRIPVRFRYVDAETEVVSEKPVIATGYDGTIQGLHYSPRLDFMPLMPEEILQSYHLARQQLGRLLQDQTFEVRFRMESGDLLMFDNTRILHGRTEFDPTTGHRHLQGCYIERDEIISRYRLLQSDSFTSQKTDS
jgi:gamma-butyrobetaine dioxygenase